MHINPFTPIRPVPAKRGRNDDSTSQAPGDFADELHASLRDQQHPQGRKKSKPGPRESAQEKAPGKSGLIDTSA